MQTLHGDWESEGVFVVAVSPIRWRLLRDRDLRPDTPPLLGFVQQIGELFEVTEVGRPWQRSYWDCLDKAVAAVVRSTQAATEPARAA
jgi:hypothetical protein